NLRKHIQTSSFVRSQAQCSSAQAAQLPNREHCLLPKRKQSLAVFRQQFAGSGQTNTLAEPVKQRFAKFSLKQLYRRAYSRLCSPDPLSSTRKTLLIGYR